MGGIAVVKNLRMMAKDVVCIQFDTDVMDTVTASSIFNGIADDIEKLDTEADCLRVEVAVRDRALKMLSQDLVNTMRYAGGNPQAAEWYAQHRMRRARAKIDEEGQ